MFLGNWQDDAPLLLFLVKLFELFAYFFFVKIEVETFVYACLILFLSVCMFLLHVVLV